MTRVILADDHPLIRRGIRDVLHASQSAVVVAEASDGEEVLPLLGEHPADVLVVDLSMPRVGGLEVIARVRRVRPELPVLVASMHPARELGVAALRVGARGYVSKHDPPARLVEAVRQLASGRRFIGPDLADRLAAEAAGNGAGPPSLSVRELQVVRALADGRSRDEIARSLAISPATVSTYKRRAREKTGSPSDAHLVRFAVREGIAS